MNGCSFVPVLIHKFCGVSVPLNFPAVQLFVFTVLFGSLKRPQVGPQLALQDAVPTLEMDSRTLNIMCSLKIPSFTYFVM